MPIQSTPPSAEQEGAYQPPPDPLMFEDFEGIDTKTTRPGIDDKKMSWCDGWMPLGKRNLRTLPDVGTLLYAPGGGKTIAFFDFANIGAIPIAVVFLSDGSIQQVRTDTGAVTQIAPPGTITVVARTNVGITQWGSQYVIIVSTQVNGYWIWNGTTFFAPGGAAPVTGLMPVGLSGSAVETYAGRVWVSNGATITFSAPGSVSNFSTASGGGTFTSSDSFLRVAYINLKATNGFLYLIGDSSINYISGVQTSGSPPSTTFTNQNADPEVGTPWAATVDVFGRNIIFANPFGAHISYGAAVSKISDDLDGVYNTVPDFAGFQPSAAKAIIFGRKIWMLLIPIINPISGVQVNKLFMWNSKFWWSSPQSITLTYVQHQEINSLITAWGTDSVGLYPLFKTPSQLFTKIVQSKLWSTPGGYQFIKTATRVWGIFSYTSASSLALTLSVDNESGSSVQQLTFNPTVVPVVNASNVTIPTVNASGTTIIVQSFVGNLRILGPTAIAQQGVLTGMTFQTQGADVTMISTMMQDQVQDYRG